MIRSLEISNGIARRRSVALTLTLCVGFFCFLFSATDTVAQRRFSRTYPAAQNVQVQLLNRTGTITVEGWNRNEVSIVADIESSSTRIEPQSLSGVILIHIVRDNQGREFGDVNFTIRVPYTSSVDIETKMGNLSVTNVRGGYIRAHISTDGDITLTNIGAMKVSAQNGIGDIFFDGVLVGGGHYRFVSINGTINLRFPLASSFSVVATAPSTRNISLGSFSNENMRFVSDGRRVAGKAGAGAATLTVVNQRGSIAFIAR